MKERTNHNASTYILNCQSIRNKKNTQTDTLSLIRRAITTYQDAPINKQQVRFQGYNQANACDKESFILSLSIKMANVINTDHVN